MTAQVPQVEATTSCHSSGLFNWDMTQPKCCQTAFITDCDTDVWLCTVPWAGVGTVCTRDRGVPLPSWLCIAVPSAGLVSLSTAPCWLIVNSLQQMTSKSCSNRCYFHSCLYTALFSEPSIQQRYQQNKVMYVQTQHTFLHLTLPACVKLNRRDRTDHPYWGSQRKYQGVSTGIFWCQAVSNGIHWHNFLLFRQFVVLCLGWSCRARNEVNVPIWL